MFQVMEGQLFILTLVAINTLSAPATPPRVVPLWIIALATVVHR